MQRSEAQRLLGGLVDWQPAGGVVSVYVDVDPGDRGEGWRIALRQQLKRVVEEASPGSDAKGVEAAAERALERLPSDSQRPEGRGWVGFVEVASDPREEWRTIQMALPATEAVHSPRPYLRPLVQVLDAGPAVGVVAASADRVRVLEWELGRIAELADWEMEVFSLDWRERKAERARDPARGTGTTAAGRDQYDQRMGANRERFLHEAGKRIGEEMGKRPWRHIVVFGDDGFPSLLAEGLGQQRAPLVECVSQDLIRAGDGELAERTADVVARLNRERALALVGTVEEAIGATPGAALGPQEVLEALAQGRARHLIFDAERDYDGRPLKGSYDGDEDGELPLSERMIGLAVATGAEITPVEGDAAAHLDRHAGVAALLRY